MAMTVIDDPQKKAKSYLNPDDYINQGNDYLTQAANLVSGNKQYDPFTDPIYQSAQVSAARNAQTAGNQSMAEMNRRGILNSTVTSDRNNRINQEYMQKVTDLIPQLAGNYQNQQQNQISNYQNLANSYLNQGQNMQNRAMQQEQFDKNYALNLAAQQANATGYYTDPSLSYDSILQQMEANSAQWQKNPNNDPTIAARNKQLNEQNIALGALIGKEYDPATGTYSAGAGRVIGTPTLDLQKMLYGQDQDQQQLLTNTALQTAQIFGQGAMINPGQSPMDIANQYAGQETLNSKQNQQRNDIDLAQLDIARKNAETSRKSTENSITNSQLSNLFEQWKLTDSAPEGIPGVPAGTPLPKKEVSSNAGITPKESTDNLQSAIKYLESNTTATMEQKMGYAQSLKDYLTDADYRTLINSINKNAPVIEDDSVGSSLNPKK